MKRFIQGYMTNEWQTWDQTFRTLGCFLCTYSQNEHLCWVSAKGAGKPAQQCCQVNGNFMKNSKFCKLSSSWEVALSFYSSLRDSALLPQQKSIQSPAFNSRASGVNKMKAPSLIGTSFVKQNGRVTEMSKHFPVIWATYLCSKQLPKFSA